MKSKKLSSPSRFYCAAQQKLATIALYIYVLCGCEEEKNIRISVEFMNDLYSADIRNFPINSSIFVPSSYNVLFDDIQ